MISWHSSAGPLPRAVMPGWRGAVQPPRLGGELGFHGAATTAAPTAMNRFNGLCKVCSERRYRQVGPWHWYGVWGG